jgi:2-polyprenyl-3-methyl-5-hydroxy-6-metoxy-1,4-benzoquinol methylase
MKYINQYLEGGMRVLDIGAGTGMYSIAIAEKGFRVDAVELIQHNIDKLLTKVGNVENVTVKQGNALDLSFIQDNTYDITLLMGPMYHLYSKEDKFRAMSEAIRVTKPKGLLFISYCIADASIIDFGFKKGNVIDLIEKKMLDTEKFIAHSEPWDIFDLVRKSDIDDLMSEFETERLHYVATDGFTRHMKETIQNMDDRVFDIYLKYHYTICENEDMVGITHHSLDIVRKP